MWYSQGTVTATNNSTTITGAGTQFIANVRVGDGITIQGSSSLHEVVGIASNTQMTINPAFLGTTGGGKQYACAPILGYDKDLSDSFNQLRLQFGDKLSSLQPWAYAATAGAALDSLGFSASGKDIASGDIITQVDAETGTSTVAKAFTAQRVRQAITGWWNSLGTAFGRGFLSLADAAAGRSKLGLGTASTADVTTSDTDTTSGRVLKVGDGGWMGRGGADTYPGGYPSTIGSSYTTVYRRSEVDNGVSAYSPSFRFASVDTWGAIRVNYSSVRAWLQGGLASAGTGWTSQVVLSANLYQGTGQATVMPMSQKATTDAINGVSDSRDKVDIQPTDVGLNLIEQLNPVSFRLNKRDWYRADEAKKFETITDEEGNETEQTTICQETLKKPLSEYADNDASLAREDVYTGLIAQEVKEAYESLGLDMAVVKNMADEYEGGEDRFYIEYNGLIPVLINAIKELSDRVKHLESVSLENTTGVVDENV